MALNSMDFEKIVECLIAKFSIRLEKFNLFTSNSFHAGFIFLEDSFIVESSIHLVQSSINIRKYLAPPLHMVLIGQQVRVYDL